VRVSRLFYPIALAGLSGVLPAQAEQVEAERALTLAPVEVKGEAGARSARAGMLGTLEVMETPFSTAAYSREDIDNLHATDISAVLGKLDASIYAPAKRGLMETFMVRGFSVWGQHDLAFNGLSGMAPIMRSTTEMLERIEVQKGPSATLNGMAPDGSVGGSINLVAKRAGDAPLARMTATYESDAQFGLHMDAGRRFGKFGIRVNAVARDGDTAVDQQQHKLALGAVALDWRGERVRILADLYRQHEHLDGMNYFGIAAFGPGVTAMPKALDGDHNLAPPWAFNSNNTTMGMVRVEWDISASTSAYAAYGRREASYDALVGTSMLINDAGALLTQITRQYYRQIAYSGQAGLNGAFNTGALTHHWSLAATTYDARWGVSRDPTTAPRFGNLSALDHGLAPVFTGFSTDPALASKTQLDGAALADRMTLLDERVQFTLGVRRQRITLRPAGYRESAWSPTFALLIKPRADMSLYASYIQGLSQGGSAPATAANAFETLAPLKTEQVETGVKLDRERFTVTAALFEITRPNAYTDPATNIYAASGEQRNRGMELSLVGEVAPGLRLSGGVSWIEAKLRKQLDPSSNGHQATGVPKFIARLGADYALPALPALALTTHLNHVGKYWPTQDNRLAAASSFTLDLGARYAAKIGGHALTLRANVGNVFNKAYWGGTTVGSALGSPRTLMLSASVDF